MNAENMWEAFAKENNLTEQTYEAWAFGAQADELAELVRRGEKTATAYAYPLYELGGDPLPKEGEYSGKKRYVLSAPQKCMWRRFAR